MTARPLRLPRPSTGLRVIQGRRLHRPVVAPWMVFAAVVIVAFLGMVIARTTLDRGAFELAELEKRISEEQIQNRRLLLEVARLESPARIGPMAEEMGMVYPEERQPLLVEGVTETDPEADPRWAGMEVLAAEGATHGGVAP